MKKSIFFLLLLGIVSQSVFPQTKTWKETDEQRNQRMKWWTEARFGMFIHWGLYAETGRTTNVKSAERMTDEEYDRYFDVFEPDLYDPREWAKAAKEAGMKYVVITAKHQEGFCLWDSDQTDYKITNTPYGNDLLKPFVEAFRAEGLRVGFYYSGADWHHPDFPIGYGSVPHPLRDSKDKEKLNKGRDLNKYVEYAQNQIKELLGNYGKIDIFWSDYGSDYSKGGDEDALVRLIRGMQPQVILNDRFFTPRTLSGLGWKWDFRSPEQTMPSEWVTMEGQRVPWELCHTLEGMWGYQRDIPINNRHGWKTNRQLIVLLIESVSKGGNLLLNIGPTARGKFNNNSMERLKAIGQWMNYHSRSIYGCTAAPAEFKTPENCLLTYNPEKKRIYVHILEWPSRLLHLDGNFAGRVKYARFLNDASEIQFADGKGYWDFVWSGDAEDISSRKNLKTLTLLLPIVQPDVEIPVIELILK